MDDIILGAFRILVDWGFDMDRNSARDLLDAINEVLRLAKEDTDIMNQLQDAIKLNNELENHYVNFIETIKYS